MAAFKARWIRFAEAEPPQSGLSCATARGPAESTRSRQEADFRLASSAALGPLSMQSANSTPGRRGSAENFRNTSSDVAGWKEAVAAAVDARSGVADLDIVDVESIQLPKV